MLKIIDKIVRKFNRHSTFEGLLNMLNLSLFNVVIGTALHGIRTPRA